MWNWLFIAFIGLDRVYKFVIGGSILLRLFSVEAYRNEVNGCEGSFNDVGITVLLAVIEILITCYLLI